MDPKGETFPYEQTAVSCPTAPAAQPLDIKVMRAMQREIFVDYPVDEPRILTGYTAASSFFKGNDIIQYQDLLSNIKYGQKLTVTVKKDQNPRSLYQKSALSYDDIDACHSQIELSCTVPCISTEPSFELLEIVLDNEYAYGVRWCDKNTDFWNIEYAMEQYRLSKEGYMFGRENDMWNTIVKGLIAAPAKTVDNYVAQDHPTHYWSNLGSVAANARFQIMEGVQYMIDSYGFNPTVFIPKEMATEIIRSVENPYNLNLSQVLQNTYEAWNVPGYYIAEGVRTIIGAGDTQVVIMQRSPWLSAAGCESYPLWNANRTKQYVAILDPRVGYDFSVPGYHLDIQPYDCDKLTKGMIDTEYVAMGITFPQYGMIQEYDMPKHGGGGGETPATAISFGEASATVTAGETEGLEATVTPADATTPVVFTTSNAEVATVVAGGEDGRTAMVTGVAAGVAAITATAGNVNATIVVTVEAA